MTIGRGTMRRRWIIAAGAALVLAFGTLETPPPGVRALAAAMGLVRPAPFSCPSDAKPARLDFTLTDMNGAAVALSAYRGKVILLDFWATWCGPCKVEIPGFVDLQARYGDRGLQVIGVSVDDPIEAMKPYAARYKMNYPVVQGLGHADLMDAYGPIWGIPVSIVISRTGAICATHAGMTGQDTFEREITSLL
jgi:peroxiredoxin